MTTKVVAKKGDVLLTKAYVEVLGTTSVRLDDGSTQRQLDVQDSASGQHFKITGNDLIDSMESAEYFVKEEAVTMSKLAEILTTTYATPFTVNFTKVDGSNRTMRARFVSIDPLMGRSNVEDLDLDFDPKKPLSRFRKVDHREILWLVVGGTKYTLKTRKRK